VWKDSGRRNRTEGIGAARAFILVRSTTMTTKTNLKSGGWMNNHNETLVRDSRSANLKTKTKLRAGTLGNLKYGDIVLKRG
jgi:hypothetical protein